MPFVQHKTQLHCSQSICVTVGRGGGTTSGSFILTHKPNLQVREVRELSLLVKLDRKHALNLLFSISDGCHADAVCHAAVA